MTTLQDLLDGLRTILRTYGIGAPEPCINARDDVDALAAAWNQRFPDRHFAVPKGSAARRIVAFFNHIQGLT